MQEILLISKGIPPKKNFPIKNFAIKNTKFPLKPPFFLQKFPKCDYTQIILFYFSHLAKDLHHPELTQLARDSLIVFLIGTDRKGSIDSLKGRSDPPGG